MTITVKNTTADLIVPPSVRRRAGFKSGDLLEFKVSGGVITIHPKRLAATDGDEYTSEQRRILDAQIAEGLEDVRRGRVSRRFDTVDEMLASMKAGKRVPLRHKTRSR